LQQGTKQKLEQKRLTHPKTPTQSSLEAFIDILGRSKQHWKKGIK
jgi:hypothetical protein